MKPRVSVAVNLVVFALEGADLQVLVERRTLEPFAGMWQLPGDFVGETESLEEAAERLLAGRRNAYVEQLRTFGDPGRNPRGHVIAVSYLAVVPGGEMDPGDVFLPARRPPELAFDHARMLDAGLKRLRAKTEYATVPLRFLEEPFTLSEVQAVYEALLERSLDKRNFRKKFLALEAIVETDEKRRTGAHRPARLFRLSPSRPYFLKERGILFPF